MGNTNRQKVDKNSPGYIVSQYKAARANLLLALAFTVVNIILFLSAFHNHSDSFTYFLFSASLPYYSVVFYYAELGVTVIIAAVLMLAVYLLCYFFSKKSYGWMIAALVFFCLDSLYLVFLALSNAEIFMDFILDIAFHAFVLFYLIQGVRYGKRYAAAEQELLAAAANPAMDMKQPNGTENQLSDAEAQPEAEEPRQE